MRQQLPDPDDIPGDQSSAERIEEGEHDAPRALCLIHTLQLMIMLFSKVRCDDAHTLNCRSNFASHRHARVTPRSLYNIVVRQYARAGPLVPFTTGRDERRVSCLCGGAART
jgi:hypothetical protein